MRKFHIIGACHVDIAWHGDEEQYASYLEQFTLILIDLLERHPDMTYVIEQAYHYKKLAERRPELVEKLTHYIKEGRVEVVGGMISTMETNIPCGESFVRNQLMGLNWFREHMNAQIKTGWLVDTFGLNAQIPQILADFGMNQMMGSRFGEIMRDDVFYAVGLDGTKTLTVGRDTFSPNLPPPERTRFFLEFAPEGIQTDKLFEEARRTKLEGPIMVNHYVEDEIYPTGRFISRAHSLQEDVRALGDRAEFSTTDRFMDELRQVENIPSFFADLNPTFTGCFAQRIQIRLNNRRAENAVLEAEKWLALRGAECPKELHDAWWDFGFVHFHDVFTGSHPDSVYRNVLMRLDSARTHAKKAMETLFGPSETTNCTRIQAVNSLPYPRSEWVSIPVMRNYSVAELNNGQIVPSFTDGQNLCFKAEVGAFAAKIYVLTPYAAPSVPFPNNTVLENEYIRLTVDADEGVTLLNKATGRPILDRVKDLLILQGDTGNFQIEKIESAEKYAWVNPVQVIRENACTIRAIGAFPGRDCPDAAWELQFTLRPGEKALGLTVHVNWQAIGKRLRLKLNTSLYRAGEGIYEVPFGVVHRRSYTPGFCRKGEWPAQRFVSLEDGVNGIALINDGVPGVETLNGTLYSTLLRAPTQVYSGMVPDDSSQQHQTHTFHFALYPYTGVWQDSELLQLAQNHNLPMRIFAAGEDTADQPELLSVSSPSILLSAVKQPENTDQNGFFIRLYESSGKAQRCTLRISGLKEIHESNLPEEIGANLPSNGDHVSLEFAPWQIRTFHIVKE